MNRAIGSLVLSTIASAAATFVLRRLLEARGGPAPPGGEGARQGQFAPNIVIVWMPVLVGNSGNELGMRRRTPSKFKRFRRR